MLQIQSDVWSNLDLQGVFARGILEEIDSDSCIHTGLLIRVHDKKQQLLIQKNVGLSPKP